MDNVQNSLVTLMFKADLHQRNFQKLMRIAFDTDEVFISDIDFEDEVWTVCVDFVVMSAEAVAKVLELAEKAASSGFDLSHVTISKNVRN